MTTTTTAPIPASELKPEHKMYLLVTLIGGTIAELREELGKGMPIQFINQAMGLVVMDFMVTIWPNGTGAYEEFKEIESTMPQIIVDKDGEVMWDATKKVSQP